MYTFDLTTISGFLASLWALLRGALAFDPDAYVAALTRPGGAQLSLAVLFVAGLSLTLGRSAILFANRVKRRRFLLSLILSSLLLVVGVLFWSATVDLLANYLFDAQLPFRTVLIVVCLGHAPLIYGLFVLLPYLGRLIDIVLHIWILLNVVGGIMAVERLALWQALLCCLLGWGLLEMASRLPFIKTVENGLWRLTTGLPHWLNTKDLVDRYVRELRTRARPLTGDRPEESER